jgi:hypothetical protein
MLTLCTTRFNVKKFYILSKQCVSVSYGTENKQRLFPYTTLAECFFLPEVEFVYCAVRTEYLNIIQVTPSL